MVSQAFSRVVAAVSSKGAHGRLPPLWLSLAAATAAYTVLFGVVRWISHFVANPYEEDFRLNWVAAKIGLTYGWSHIYDLDLQHQLTAALNAPGIGIDTFHAYITPPPLAWLLVPFTLLTVPAGYLLWTIASLAAVSVAWWLVCPGKGAGRLTLLLIGIAIWPMHYTLWLGQTAAITILCLALAWWFTERERWAPAGAAMAIAMFIKPQVVLLLPVALLVSGRWKPVVYWALASAFLGGISLLSMGSHGIAAYVSSVNYAQTNLIHSVMTYAWFAPRSVVATGIEVTAGAVALALAWFRRDRMDLVFALGILASTASAFYLHEYDPAVWVLLAWLVLRSRPSVPQQVWLVAGIVAAQLVAIAFFKPLLVWEAGWILLLGMEPWLASRFGNWRGLTLAPNRQ
jgi:hypothetical protein